MAKKKIPLPKTVIEPVVLVRQKKWFIKIGKEFYRRLQPVPYETSKPDLKQFV